MSTPSHADVQTGTLALPALTVTRWSRVIALLAAIALIGGVACLQFGSERIPLADVARILLSGGDETLTGASGVSWSVIVLEVRLPRVLLAFLVGASLAAVGVALQALLRNPLADPYILGVSSGGGGRVERGAVWAGAEPQSVGTGRGDGARVGFGGRASEAPDLPDHCLGDGRRGGRQRPDRLCRDGRATRDAHGAGRRAPAPLAGGRFVRRRVPDGGRHGRPQLAGSHGVAGGRDHGVVRRPVFHLPADPTPRRADAVTPMG